MSAHAWSWLGWAWTVCDFTLFSSEKLIYRSCPDLCQLVWWCACFSFSEEASKVMVELLNTYTDENASEAKEDAQNCIVSFLAKPNVLIMDHLLRLRPVAALEGEPIHRVSSCSNLILFNVFLTSNSVSWSFWYSVFFFLKLLTIFISGRLNDYTKFREVNEGYIESLGECYCSNLVIVLLKWVI